MLINRLLNILGGGGRVSALVWRVWGEGCAVVVRGVVSFFGVWWCFAVVNSGSLRSGAAWDFIFGAHVVARSRGSQG